MNDNIISRSGSYYISSRFESVLDRPVLYNIAKGVYIFFSVVSWCIANQPKTYKLWWLISCQLDSAVGRLGIRSNIILCISVRVFWIRVTSSLIDWVKQITLPNVNGPHPICWKPELNKKADSPWVRENSCCLTAFDLGCRLLNAFTLKLKHQLALGLGLPDFGLELHHLFFWFLGLST